MALEVLFGPTPITRDGTALDSFGGDQLATYIQGLGILGFGVDPVLAGRCLAVQLDGVAYSRTDFTGVSTQLIPDLRYGPRGLAVNVVSQYLYNFNWLAGRPDEDPWLHAPTGFFGSIQAVCADRFLQFSGLSVSSSNLNDGKTFTLETTLTGASPGGPWSVSAAGPTELCVMYAGGLNPQIRFYDVVQKKQSRPTKYLDQFYDGGCWYVPKYDIFAAVKAVSGVPNVYVLADAVHPASVSNPVFSPAPAAGLVSTVSVQVLGAQSEPCVGELINWTITAGGGSLTQTQSVTDDTGTATTGYIAPPALTGSVTIHTDLEF